MYLSYHGKKNKAKDARVPTKSIGSAMNALGDPDDERPISPNILFGLETGCSLGNPVLIQAVGPDEGLAVGGLGSIRALT